MDRDLVSVVLKFCRVELWAVRLCGYWLWVLARELVSFGLTVLAQAELADVARSRTNCLAHSEACPALLAQAFWWWCQEAWEGLRMAPLC